MKNFTKIFLIIISALITIQFLSLSFLILAPTVYAEEPPEGIKATDIRDNIKVPFGDFADLGEAKYVTCTGSEDGSQKCWQIPWIAKYVGNAYRYGVVIGSILAVMMIMIGGIMYMIGGLNQSLIGRGKEYIVGAVTGLILLLGSYVVLQTINPNLVHLQPIEVELIKEARITNVKFCNELPLDKYEIIGSTACGQKMQFKARDPNIDEKGECFGWECEGKKKCVPASIADTENFQCRDVLIWGYIKDYTDRYVDRIALYPVQGEDVESKVFEQDLGYGHSVYYIYRDAVDEVELNKYTQAVLEIELNDTGAEKAQLTYGEGIGGKIMQFLTPTADDDFYVGRNVSTHPNDDNYIGTWINPSCTTCGGAHPTKPGAKPNQGDGWMYDTNCAYFKVGKIITDGIRVDIDSNNFREDSEIDCKIVDMLSPAGPKLPVYSPCGSNAQCASGDCESEGGIQRCECNKNGDCNEGETCITSVATWNICVKGIYPGESCAPDEDEKCISKDCVGGKCDCDVDADCKYEEYCAEAPGAAADICKFKLTPGASCTPITGYNPNDEYDPPAGAPGDKIPVMGACTQDSWYDVAEGATPITNPFAPVKEEWRVECLVDKDCGANKRCIKINDECGWNYCVNADYKIPSVPEGYDATQDPEHANSYGLCWNNADCESGKCGKDKGARSCDVCIE